jgi:hypothetical protein
LRAGTRASSIPAAVTDQSQEQQRTCTDTSTAQDGRRIRGADDQGFLDLRELITVLDAARRPELPEW